MNIYRLKMGTTANVVDHLRQGLETRIKYSKPVGFWISELGPISHCEYASSTVDNILLTIVYDIDEDNHITSRIPLVFAVYRFV